MARFSSRISWSLQTSRIARAIDSRRGSLHDLTQSNPTDAGLSYPSDRILRALSDPRLLHYDPSAKGLLSARQTVSEYYEGTVTPERILLTASTSEAYSYVFKLLCDPGDAILVPRPSYPLFEFLAQLEAVEVVQYPMHYHQGWYIDLDALAASVTGRTRAVVFVNPNNPTGSFLKAHEYEFLASLCRRHGLALITDEVFADYGFGQDPARVRSVAGRDDVLTFVLSGLSKVSALPQLKLGWIAVGGPQADRGAALERLELIADTFLSVGTPVQYAAVELLAVRFQLQQQIASRTQANLAILKDLARDTPARVLDVEGGWYATLEVPRVRSEEEWVIELIEHYGTLVQPGFFYDFESEAYLILSLLTESDTFAEGARRNILACKGSSA
jgi:alanine-synthesizing transaminase